MKKHAKPSPVKSPRGRWGFLWDCRYALPDTPPALPQMKRSMSLDSFDRDALLRQLAESERAGSVPPLRDISDDSGLLVYANPLAAEFPIDEDPLSANYIMDKETIESLRDGTKWAHRMLEVQSAISDVSSQIGLEHEEKHDIVAAGTAHFLTGDNDDDDDDEDLEDTSDDDNYHDGREEFEDDDDEEDLAVEVLRGQLARVDMGDFSEISGAFAAGSKRRNRKKRQENGERRGRGLLGRENRKIRRSGSVRKKKKKMVTKKVL